MTASLYRKYNTFSDRESEQQHRTMTFAELAMLKTMLKPTPPKDLGGAFPLTP